MTPTTVTTPETPDPAVDNALELVDATFLAQAAEWADGDRDKPLYLVKKGNRPHLTEKLASGEKPILRVRTPNRTPNRKRPKITITGSDGAQRAIDSDFDSVFWTESSAEKFLFPYYAVQRLYPPEELDRLRKQFMEDENAIALGHTLRSQFSTITDPRDSLQVLVERLTVEGKKMLEWIPASAFLR